MEKRFIFGLIILIILVGCSGDPLLDPPPQDEPAPVKLVNNASINETFRVSVIPVGDN